MNKIQAGETQMSDVQRPWRLIFVGSDLDPHDTVDRGYRSHVLVEIATSLYPVFFYDCGRLQCELQEMAKHGRPFIAETGMIVLESVTLAAMELAVQKLYEEGYFDYFKSIDQNRLAAANPYAWPP